MSEEILIGALAMYVIFSIASPWVREADNLLVIWLIISVLSWCIVFLVMGIITTGWSI